MKNRHYGLIYPTSPSISLIYAKKHFLNFQHPHRSSATSFSLISVSSPNLLLTPSEKYLDTQWSNLPLQCNFTNKHAVSGYHVGDHLRAFHLALEQGQAEVLWAQTMKFCSTKAGKVVKKGGWADFPLQEGRSLSLPLPGARQVSADIQPLWVFLWERLGGRRGGKGRENLFPSSRFSPTLTCLSMKKKKSPIVKLVKWDHPSGWREGIGKEEEMPWKPFSFWWFRKGIECYCLTLNMFFMRRSCSRHIIF